MGTGMAGGIDDDRTGDGRTGDDPIGDDPIGDDPGRAEGVGENAAGAMAERILDEAERQILRRGNGKLRVVDIAAALGMSHGNIYRYFPKREALLDALVDRWLQHSIDRAQMVIAKGGSAAEILTGVVINLHEATRDKLAAGQGVFEIYTQALTKRAGAVETKRGQLLAIASGIMEEGCRRGEFAIPVSAIPRALAILDAMTTRFTHPLLIKEGLVQRERERRGDTVPAAQVDARAVMTLFVTALKTTPDVFCGHPPPPATPMAAPPPAHLPGQE